MSAQLSKSAKVLEEDRKKVASIRSFLLNFLEERDCSIKKRLVSALLYRRRFFMHPSSEKRVLLLYCFICMGLGVMFSRATSR